MSSDASASVRVACVFAAGVALGCAAALAASRAVAPRQPPAPCATAAGAAEPPPAGAPSAPLSLDDEITAEQLTRNIQFFGRAGQQCVSDAFVIVVGLGVRARALRLPCGSAARAGAHAGLARRRAWAATRQACCCAQALAGCASSTSTR
jgi:hypothetical protein